MQSRTSRRLAASAGGFLCLGILLHPALSDAHQFWVQPDDYRISAGEELRAQLLVGESFKGAAFPYLSHRFQRFEAAQNGKRRRVRGQEGQDPALRHETRGEGLLSVAYLSKPDRADFLQDWETFEEYLRDEGLDWVVEAHDARGLPRTAFAELYTRCAKSLVQVGPASPVQRDQLFGMPLEFLAQVNPYALEPGGTLPLQLLWRGEPAGGVQITVLQKAASVNKTLLRSDEEGRIELPLGEGGEFLLSAVLMESLASGLDFAGDDPVWASYWASLSFEVPGDDGGQQR